ncbi:MAG: dTMP kinase [bacterium]
MSFAVIEGLDGSGKSTQIKLLREYLVEKAIPYKYLHFPRTDAPVYGDLIARFLRGELGNISDVNPYLIALIYAGDRNDARAQILKWLDDGYFVLVDRYVFSNIAFQCAKLENQKERDELKEWILHLEYDYHHLPRPDVNLFLDVPFRFTQKQLSDKREGEDREYLKGRDDIHEANLDFQKNVREVYLSMKDEKEFSILQCYNTEEEIYSPVEIFNKIIKILFHDEVAQAY